MKQDNEIRSNQHLSQLSRYNKQQLASKQEQASTLSNPNYTCQAVVKKSGGSTTVVDSDRQPKR